MLSILFIHLLDLSLLILQVTSSLEVYQPRPLWLNAVLAMLLKQHRCSVSTLCLGDKMQFFSATDPILSEFNVSSFASILIPHPVWEALLTAVCLYQNYPFLKKQPKY